MAISRAITIGNTARGAEQWVSPTTVASAASTIASPTLDLNTDEYYEFVISLKNATGSSANLSLYFNADTTAANYDREGATDNNTTLTGSRTNDATIATLDANDTCDIKVSLWIDQNGKPCAMLHTIRGSGTGIIQTRSVLKWHTANTNVVLATISSSVASSITGTFNAFKRSRKGITPASYYGPNWPSNPQTTDPPFFNTTKRLWGFWDGSRWLSCEEYSSEQSNRDSSALLTASTTSNAAPRAAGIFVTDVVWSVRIAGTNDATNYWTCAFQAVNFAGGVSTTTTLSTLSTQSLSFATSTFQLLTGTVNQAFSNATVLSAVFTKVASAGNAYPMVRFNYRLIIT